MRLLLFLLRCLGFLRNSLNSWLGGFNSRLGRLASRLRVLREIGLQGVDSPQYFPNRMAVPSGKSMKFPAQWEKPGISSVAAGRLAEAIEPHSTTGHDLMRARARLRRAGL